MVDPVSITDKEPPRTGLLKCYFILGRLSRRGGVHQPHGTSRGRHLLRRQPAAALHQVRVRGHPLPEGLSRRRIGARRGLHDGGE